MRKNVDHFLLEDDDGAQSLSLLSSLQIVVTDPDIRWSSEKGGDVAQSRGEAREGHLFSGGVNRWSAVAIPIDLGDHPCEIIATSW